MRRGFGFHDRHSPFRFNPATLFAGGAQGSWYDPSDFSTLFQDSAGTTPVTGVEQVVGRMLDKSGRGNHATATGLSRPTLSARVNFLTKTEEFNDAAWTKRGTASITSNDAIAPNGTLTADRLSGLNTGSNDIFDTNYNVVTYAPNGTPYRPSIYIKRISTTGIFFIGNPNGTASGQWNVDLSMLPDAWVQITATTPGVTVANPFVTTASGNGGIIIRGVSGGPLSMHIWGADARIVNDSVNIPSYQRVNTATDYDTAGFLLYLRFDGSNDSMASSSIDFTGTDKMTVFAGMRKLSDAAQGVVAELSATIASNNGAFLLSAPNSAAANYNWSSKGTTQVDNTVTTYTAPHTAVVTGQADIAAPSNIIRVNGAQAGSVATTQGTGNFGNYPLYIGRRNNATLPFNGRLYGLIVLGAAASDWQVYVTEQWMASKTGLQF